MKNLICKECGKYEEVEDGTREESDFRRWPPPDCWDSDEETGDYVTTCNQCCWYMK